VNAAKKIGIKVKMRILPLSRSPSRDLAEPGELCWSELILTPPSGRARHCLYPAYLRILFVSLIVRVPLTFGLAVGAVLLDWPCNLAVNHVSRCPYLLVLVPSIAMKVNEQYVV